MIRINNLHKFYNQGKKNEQHVLNDITLEFPQTGLVCILGESGSGKTTLLNTVGGLDTFSGGSIVINDKEVDKYDPKVMEPIRNDCFDYIFQNYYLLKDYSVNYNIRLALNRYDIPDEEKDERISYVLRMLGMEKYKKKIVSKLSGGQQQRVSIARALVKSPDVIFADEPTGNLDEENTIRTMSILKNISKECLVLLVTHEKRIARFFGDRIIEVCDGKIIRDVANTPSESYERSDDSNIYLKELEKESISGPQAEFQVYKPKNDIPKKIELTLAWKDNKLYIQNNMPYDILIEGIENGVEMLDEERPTLELSDIDEFSYELPKMESRGSARLSPREILRISLENLRMMGKKQAFVIAILIVTAVLLSLTLAQFTNTYMMDTTQMISTDTHHIKLEFVANTSNRNYQARLKLMDYINKLSDSEYGEPFFVPQINVYLTGDNYRQLTNLTQLVQNFSFTSLTNLDESDLIYGRMPVKRNEVVLDTLLAQRLIDTKASVSSLHSTPESFLNMRLVLAAKEIDYQIVGISNTNQPVIYCGQNLMLASGTKGCSVSNLSELQAEIPNSYDNITLADDEIMVRQGLLEATNRTQAEETTIGFDSEHTYKIAGTYPDTYAVDYVMSDQGCINVRNQMIFDALTCFLYVENTEEALKHFSEKTEELGYAYELTATIPSQEEIEKYIDNHSSDMDARQLIPFAVALISMIMVYFTIKSNASSRIEELTVYRLIGISRGSILKAYMLEMILVTSYTSLPAVLITSGVLQFIRSIPSLQVDLALPWWTALVLLIFLYIVHALISILPVYGILSKPPATLAVKE